MSHFIVDAKRIGIRGLWLLVFAMAPSVFAHQGHLDDAAVLACHKQVVNDACSYMVGHNKRYIGSCQVMVNTLMCVRNQPIELITTTAETSAEQDEHAAVHSTEPHALHND